MASSENPPQFVILQRLDFQGGLECTRHECHRRNSGKVLRDRDRWRWRLRDHYLCAQQQLAVALFTSSPPLGRMRGAATLSKKPFIAPGRHHADAVESVEAVRVAQNKVPNILLANEPSLSTQGMGGSCGS